MNTGPENKSEMNFYKCEICGNIILKLHDSGINPQCCSRTMSKVVSGDSDGAPEKHVPVCKIDGDLIEIQVGAEDHPMESDHHIEWILLKTNLGFHTKFLAVNHSPKACFKLVHGEKAEFIYCYCNLHGIYKSCVDEE